MCLFNFIKHKCSFETIVTSASNFPLTRSIYSGAEIDLNVETVARLAALVTVSVSVGATNGRVDISLPKLNAGIQWSSLGVAGQHDNAWLKTSAEG